MQDENALTDVERISYNRKHKRIRGSDDLKYPPREARCKLGCGQLHYEPDTSRGAREHPCFLKVGHADDCQFSSECKSPGELAKAI